MIRYKVISNFSPKVRSSVYAGGVYEESYPVGQTRRAKGHTVGFLVFGTSDHAEMWIQKLVEERDFKLHHLAVIQVECKHQLEVSGEVPAYTSQSNLDLFYKGVYRCTLISLPEGTECWREVTALD